MLKTLELITAHHWLRIFETDMSTKLKKHLCVWMDFFATKTL